MINANTNYEATNLTDDNKNSFEFLNSVNRNVTISFTKNLSVHQE